MFSFRDQQPAAYIPPLSNAKDKACRLYLHVPFDKKDEAKRLGAKWDKDLKRWFAPNGEKELVDRWGDEARLLTVLQGEDRTFGGDTLCVEFQPKSCWCKKIQYAIQSVDRARVQDFVFGRTNRTCETCGVQDVERDFHLHGRWEYAEGTQRLVRLMALCDRCYESTHFGTAHYHGRREQAVAHLKQTMNRTDAECQEHINSAYKLLDQRNKQDWTVDLSLLSSNGIACESASRLKSFIASKSTRKPKAVEHRAREQKTTYYSFR